MIFLLGGQSCGKSQFALRLAIQYAKSQKIKKYAFIATALLNEHGHEAKQHLNDSELAVAIARHQKERQRSSIPWQVYEEGRDIPKVLKQIDKQSMIVLDCFSMIISNIIYDYSRQMSVSSNWQKSDEKFVHDKVDLIIDAVLGYSGNLLVVSLEAGLGNVPMIAMSRSYNRILGHCNQRLTQAASHAYLVVAGGMLPLHNVQSISEQFTLTDKNTKH